MPSKKKKEDDYLPGEVLTEDNLDLLPGEELSADNSQELTRTGLQKFGQDVEEAITTPVVPANVPGIGGSSVANLATLPQRGFRGVGVGLQQAVEGVPASSLTPFGAVTPEILSRVASNLPGAVERAAEAVRPGFQPEEGERLGALAGETVGSLPLATALGGSSEAVGAGNVALQIMRNTVGGATLTAINEASEKGDIEVPDVVFSGAVNGLFPLVRPSANVVANFLRKSTEIPVAGTTTLSREAMGELADDPKLLEKYAGDAQAINNKVVNIQKKMVEQFEKIGNRLKQARLKFGITRPLETPVEQVAAEGLPQKDLKEIASDFIDLKRGYRLKKPIEGVDVGIVPPKPGRELPKQDINIKERIKGLYELRSQIDQNNVVKNKVGQDVQPIDKQDIEGKYLKNLRGQINNMLDELTPQVEGGSALRITDRAFSQARNLYDEFIKKLADKEKGEQLLLNIYKKGNPDEIIGINSDTVDVLRRLEKRTGEKYIEPLRKEFAAREFRNIKGTGGGNALSLFGAPGAVLETAGARGNSAMLNAVFGLSSIIKRLGEFASSPQARRVAIGATSALQNQQGENR